MSVLRLAAAGRQCMVRMPSICNGRADDCVLAHAHFPGLRGTAQKAHDALGAWACSACHDEYDRRTRVLDADTARLWFYEGVLRTQRQLIDEGMLMEISPDAAPVPERIRTRRPAALKKRPSKGRTASPAKCLPRILT